MSFLIKDKKKISIFRKCVQILTATKEEFHLHLTKTHIRLFNTFQDETTYMIDFQAPWFSKFVAPECILQQELEILQIKCSRDIFLQSFNIIDDFELEFILQFEDINTGSIKVIKTRDHYVIEANVPFEIERDIKSDENYEFPENQLLIDSDIKNIKSLKGVFKSNAKSEILQIAFSDDGLYIKGEQGVNRFGYEIKSNLLNTYGNYLSSDNSEKQKEFIIAMALKHILGMIKVCELIDGKFLSAMELIEQTSCVCFLFTHSLSRDFKFCIGMANVKFSKITDVQVLEEEEKATSRLRKVEQPAIKKESRNDNDVPAISGLNLKCEDNTGTGMHSTHNNGEIEMIDTTVKRNKGKANKGKTKKIVDDEQDFNEEQLELLEQEEAIANEVDQQLNVKEESSEEERTEVKNNKKKKKQKVQRYSDDSEDDEEDIKARKADFYKEVDKEEFF